MEEAVGQGDQEIEVKFYLRDLAGLEERLKRQGAALVAERVFEINLRFDRPDKALQRAGQVLRLRQDTRSVVTFKGPARGAGGASARQEIEFQVDDFEAARRVFEALGYQVSVMYEKFRTTYRLEDVLVTLDEMPYGAFAEIESAAGSAEAAARAIRAAAERLGLDWEARITLSYLAIFDQLRSRRGLTARNLSFAEFQNITVTAEDLSLRYGD